MPPRTTSQSIDQAFSQLLPYDGPKSAESTIGAAEGLELITRYLTNALNVATRQDAAPFDGTFAAILRSLSGTAGNLLQLLDRLRLHVEEAGNRGTIADDRDLPPAEAADAVAAEIMSARAALYPLLRHLQGAASGASHLGVAAP